MAPNTFLQKYEESEYLKTIQRRGRTAGVERSRFARSWPVMGIQLICVTCLLFSTTDQTDIYSTHNAITQAFCITKGDGEVIKRDWQGELIKNKWRCLLDINNSAGNISIASMNKSREFHSKGITNYRSQCHIYDTNLYIFIYTCTAGQTR